MEEDIFSLSTSGFAQVNDEGVITGIDWSSVSTTAVTSTGGLHPIYTEYFTFRPTTYSMDYINLDIKIDRDGTYSYVKYEDHFIEHEDLFEI